MKILTILKNKRMVERTKKALEYNPKRNRRSSSTISTKVGKHSGGLTSSQRRRRSIKRAELEALRNPWMAF